MSPELSEHDSIDISISKGNLHVEKTDVNRSLSSLTPTINSLDNILRKCGDFGRFQLIHYFFMNWISMSFGITSFYYVFGAAEAEHRCRLPHHIWPNDTQYNPVDKMHEMYINKYIPKDVSGQKWEKCVQYSAGNTNDTLVSCLNGWVYDRSVFGYTFTEEANFVCEYQARRSWLAVAIQSSGFSLLIIGSLADKYGRKKMIVIISIILSVTCFLTQIILRWMSITIKMKFFILLLNQFASGLVTSNFSLVLILMLELTSSAYTSFAGNLAFISYSIGEVLVALFAYLTRDWQDLKWASLIFIGLGLPYLHFMPESPLYLYAKGQYTKLESLLRRIARQNGRTEAEWYPHYQDLLNSQPVKLISRQDSIFPQITSPLLRNRKIILQLLIVCLMSLTLLMIYFQISYGLAMMDVSPYLAILIGAVCEAFSYITSSILISTKLARKGSFIFTMCLTIVFILLIPIMKGRSPIMTICVALAGKYSISAVTAISWIYVPEIFPTSIRSTANGFFIAFSRIGAILAPVISTLIHKEYLSYTFYASSIFAVVVLFCSLFLPETKDKPMDSEPEHLVSRNEI
ncbi:unnamed protein product [Adineta ricciae]|uniref:Major facilitator superfamily (MFS) profile domain-containing protein n=1 Tax=Adineta ricciae TaxID=249248 RepID=A0A814UPD3_ADIRI|nr:unnamed protein product [Adineta ricciae]CAF1177526.1 unnamed protein product [Adineta ricciae]